MRGWEGRADVRHDHSNGGRAFGSIGAPALEERPGPAAYLAISPQTADTIDGLATMDVTVPLPFPESSPA